MINQTTTHQSIGYGARTSSRTHQNVIDLIKQIHKDYLNRSDSQKIIIFIESLLQDENFLSLEEAAEYTFTNMTRNIERDANISLRRNTIVPSWGEEEEKEENKEKEEEEIIKLPTQAELKEKKELEIKSRNLEIERKKEQFRQQIFNNPRIPVYVDNKITMIKNPVDCTREELQDSAPRFNNGLNNVAQNLKPGETARKSQTPEEYKELLELM